jgi:rod shape-determining protein MreC
MESVLGRYRNLTILVGVLFLQVLGLAVQVKRSADAENTRLIRIWAVGAITPFERGLVRVQNGSRNLWRNYFFLRGVRAENRELKAQIEQMHLEQVRLSEDAAQARRLQMLLSFKEQYIAKTVPAQVIGSSGSDLSRSMYIDKGSNDGIAPDMAVITAAGIVGKVLRVYPSTSLVLMINDQTSGVGAMLEKSRLQGVLQGTANGEVVLQRVMSDEQVAPGDTVLSSGGDQIFPKGLPVGTVRKVGAGKEMFLNILVKPAADLSRLEEVLVVTQKQEREAVAEGSGRVRAADILAQRLPSVPDKPAVDAKAASGGSASGASEQSASASAKPQLANTTRAENGNGTKLSGVSLAGGTAATRSTTTVAAPPPANGGVSSKVVEKAPSGDSAIKGNRGAAVRSQDASGATGSGTTSSGRTSSGTSSNAATFPAKPTVKRAKPANDVATPEPPAAEDNPH